MQIINTLNIDLSNPESPQRIKVMQADANTRLVEIHLSHGGVAWEIPEGVRAAFGYRKPDGTAGLYDRLPDGTAGLTMGENRIAVVLAPQVLTAPGLVRAVVTLQDANLNQLSTFPFHICVEPNPAAGLVVSDNYINVVDAIGDLNALVTDDKSSLVAAINEIARSNGGTISDDQVAQAVTKYLSENPIEGGYSTTTEITEESTDGEVPTAAAVREYVGQHAGGNVENGEDGFSPIATVQQTDTGAVISVTDANGTTTATISNGKDGADGAKGDKGDKGETGATGPRGEKGDKGAQGDKGDTGAAGADGKDGADGYTPVRGTDYYTEEDKTEMVKAVQTALSADNSWLNGYEIPKLYLTGDTTGMSKDNTVTLDWVYGENSGSCTLKWQGNSSLAYDKKNYTIKLDTAIDIGYGAQKKYCLKANYIDFSHARNIVSARLWGMMVASRSNVHETLAASPNYGAVNGFPVAIVLNGKFHGLYTFNIPKDGWMMNMGNGTQECILCADHSTATQFKGEALCDESDFEIEYITDENDTAWAVTSVNRLINACIHSNGGDLDTTIAQYLDWESAIDYYILVALLDGSDMRDKNYILATYDGVKWFFSAYDMDSTYGLKWDGSYFSKASYGDLTGFENYAALHRLMELIKRFKTNALKARYAELRADVLSESAIAREFERFACDLPSRLLDEDRNVWPMLPCTSVNNTFQILCWLNRRLAYVDKWMNDLPAQEEVVGPSYTNLVPAAIGTDGSVYNGTGYKDGYRLSSGGSAEKAQEGSTLTGFIPIAASTDIVRVKGVRLLHSTDADAGYHCYFVLYDSQKTAKGYSTVDSFQSGSTGCYDLTYDESTGVYTIGVGGMAGSYPGYFRLNAVGNGADMIVSVNEEIT